MHHTVGKGHISARLYLQVQGRVICQVNFPGIHHNQFGAPPDCAAYLSACYGMSFGWIGAYKENHIHIPCNIRNGIGHGAGTKGHGKTGHRGRVADTGAVIHVVGAKGSAHHFLEHEIVLVGCS